MSVVRNNSSGHERGPSQPPDSEGKSDLLPSR